MILAEVLHLLIEDGISEARIAYAHPVHRDVLEGAIDGYQACRDLEPATIRDLLAASGIAAFEARRSGVGHAYTESYDGRVRHVASVMSCALEYHGLPPLVRITFQARMRYAAIVGYERADSIETNRAQRR